MPDREALERNLTSAGKGLPFKPGLFQPFLDATVKAKTQKLVEMQTFRGTALGLKLDSLLFMHEDAGLRSCRCVASPTDRSFANF